MNYDIYTNPNIPKLSKAKEIKLSDDCVIEVRLYKEIERSFYEVILKHYDNNIFLGSFNKDFDNLSVSYNSNNNKILISGIDIDDSIYVLALYDIKEDFSYYCTEKEALELFDENMDTSHLKNPKKLIVANSSKKIKEDASEIGQSNTAYTCRISLDEFNKEKFSNLHTSGKEKANIIHLGKRNKK